MIQNAITYDNYRFPNKTICDMKLFKNYDIKKIRAAYMKYLMYYSNLSEESFRCLKPLFIPLTSMKPLYGLDEMICAAINLGIITESFHEVKKILLENNKLLLKVCSSVQKIDTSSNDLIKNQNHIIKKGNSNLIHYYTIHESSDLNLSLIHMYLPIIHMHRIKLIRACILISPLINKKFTFYRFFRGKKINIEDIEDINIGKIISFNQFLFCTREITTNCNKFGSTSFKILCNLKTISYYLFIEMFSDYLEEKEVLIAPGSKFKVLNIDDFYYATKSQNYLCKIIYIEYTETDRFEIGLKPIPLYNTLVSEDDLDEYKDVGFYYHGYFVEHDRRSDT